MLIVGRFLCPFLRILSKGVDELQKKTLKILLNVIFVAVVFALTLWSVFHGEDFGKVID